MLDQNTDRMWYVIGALVVGAGIILLANKTMPGVFANVMNSFSDLTEKSTHGVNQIGLGENVLDDDASGVADNKQTITWMSWDRYLYKLRMSEYDIQPGDTFTFSFYVENPTRDVSAYLQVRDETLRKYTQSHYANVIKAGESGYTTLTWTVPPMTVTGDRGFDTTPTAPIWFYASIRDVNNGSDETRETTATISQASLQKHTD